MEDYQYDQHQVGFRFDNIFFVGVRLQGLYLLNSLIYFLFFTLRTTHEVCLFSSGLHYFYHE